MKFKFHNKIEVYYNGNKFDFFNSIFFNVFDLLKTKQPFNNFIACGSGNPSSSQNDHKLTSFQFSQKLDNISENNDFSHSTPYIKKALIISSKQHDGMFISELGLTSTPDAENPEIYNYISLIDSDHPNGFLKEKNSTILIYIFVYLEIVKNESNCLTFGDNKFISYLLGNGLSGNVYATRGNNLLDNSSSIHREKPNYQNKYFCNISFEENVQNGDHSLNIKCSSNLGMGETSEIVFMIEDDPFARINLMEFKEPIAFSQDFESKPSFVVDLEKNIKTVESVMNKNSNQTETGYFLKKYASSFGDKIKLPFSNIYSENTPRFVSKDGDKIFFVSDDFVFAYQNINYSLTKINMKNISIQNISNIISFDKFIFVISKTKPFISAFVIENFEIETCTFDVQNEHFANIVEDIQNIDVTHAKNNLFMIGIISKSSHNGHTFYFTFDEQTKKFVYDSHLTSDHNFSYILAMYKNNFADSQVFYLEEGEHSFECAMVTHFPNKEIKDIYSVLSYYFTKDTRKIEVKNRAVIVEKTTEPKLWIYFYPQLYRYELSLIGEEDTNYISTNLMYLIQKFGDEYKIYNLVGYDNPKEFDGGFPEEIDKTKIESFEFLNDLIFIFTKDKNEPIIAYQLKTDGVVLENVSTNDSIYTIHGTKYNLIGKNEGVSATFSAELKLWFFQTKYLKLHLGKIQLCLQSTTKIWSCIYLSIHQQKTLLKFQL